MSDNSIALVPKKFRYPDNEAKAKEILDWLISNDIVKSEISDCTLNGKGYSVSEGAKAITDSPNTLPFRLKTNGLSVITDRWVFYAGLGDIEALICPKCNEDIAFEDWDFSPWSENKTDVLTCPSCNSGTEINQYQFDPAWGFSDLGFIFWNWPSFKEEFIEEFRKKLDCEIAIVYQHL